MKDGMNTIILRLVPGSGQRGPALASLMVVLGE
jgi:hypothetical protein